MSTPEEAECRTCRKVVEFSAEDSLIITNGGQEEGTFTKSIYTFRHSVDSPEVKKVLHYNEIESNDRRVRQRLTDRGARVVGSAAYYLAFTEPESFNRSTLPSAKHSAVQDLVIDLHSPEVVEHAMQELNNNPPV